MSVERVYGAGNETRTRDPDLGKVVLYQLSYSRIAYTPFLMVCRGGPHCTDGLGAVNAPGQFALLIKITVPANRAMLL